MGISDRDYIRRAPPTPGRYGWGGPSALRMWSVNTWLIAICIGVYVIDGFVPRTEFWYQKVTVRRVLPRHIEVAAGQQYREIEGANELRALQTGGLVFIRDMVDVSAAPPERVGQIVYQWMPPLRRWLYFSTDGAFRKVEVWRFVGFQFLHGSFSHLLLNMVGLFFFGPMVERFLGSKRYLAFYLLCGILGAVMYLVLNLGGVVASLMAGKTIAIPGLLFDSTATPLIGASAGVFGVLMAGAYLAPNALVLLFLILPMRLKTFAYLLVAIALYTVIRNGANAGGEAGHLGGALAGFYFIRRPHHLHGFFDILGRLDPTSHHYRRKGLRTTTGRRPAQTEKIDRILAKISAEGLKSLTESEKRALREASERR